MTSSGGTAALNKKFLVVSCASFLFHKASSASILPDALSIAKAKDISFNDCFCFWQFQNLYCYERKQLGRL